MLSSDEVQRIFNLHEGAPTMSYRYEVSSVLAREVARKLGCSGAFRVTLPEAEVDSVFDAIRHQETHAFRLAAADGIEHLVRVKLETAQAG